MGSRAGLVWPGARVKNRNLLLEGLSELTRGGIADLIFAIAVGGFQAVLSSTDDKAVVDGIVSVLETTVCEKKTDEDVSVLETTVDEGAGALLVAVGTMVNTVGIENEVLYSEGSRYCRQS